MAHVHDGHRERLKNRYKQHGLENFNDIEALEILLFYALPRRNTNELAHALLARFKDFRGVLEAEMDELAKVPGLGENSAALIKLVTDINRRYMAAGRDNQFSIIDSESAGEFLLPLFSYQKEETAMLVCLDSASRVVRCHNLGSGMVNKVDFSLRQVVSLALRDNATSVILAHNHLSGTALPSGTDIETSNKLAGALRLIGVRLRDHIIICDDDFVSLRDSGLLIGM